MDEIMAKPFYFEQLKELLERYNLNEYINE